MRRGARHTQRFHVVLKATGHGDGVEVLTVENHVIPGLPQGPEDSDDGSVRGTGRESVELRRDGFSGVERRARGRRTEEKVRPERRQARASGEEVVLVFRDPRAERVVRRVDDPTAMQELPSS